MPTNSSKGDIVFTQKDHYKSNKESTSVSITNCGYFITHDNPYDFRQESENQYLLIYLQKGNLEFFSGGKKQLFPSRTVLIFTPTQFRHVKYLNDPINSRYFVYFKGAMIKNYFKQLGLDKKNAYSVDDECGEKIVNLIVRILNDFKINGPFVDIYRINFLLTLFILIADSQNVKIDDTEKTINKIAFLMENECNQSYPLKHYAKESAMSLSTFIRNFKKYQQCTPIEYANKIKIKKAIFFLTETNLSIREIAFSIGMNDALYFSKFFKHATGLSPSEFRKHNKLIQ